MGQIIIFEINYIAMFMTAFMAIGILSQTRKSAYNWMLFCFYLILSVILFSSWNTNIDLSYKYPGYSLWDLPFVFMLGPLLYLIFSYTHRKGFSRKSFYHFIPAIFAWLACFPYYLRPAESKRYRLQMLFKQTEIEYSDLLFILAVLYTTGYVFYLIYGYRHLFRRELLLADHMLQFLLILLLSSGSVVLSALLGIILQDYMYYRICALLIAVSAHLYFLIGYRTPNLHEAMVTFSTQRHVVKNSLTPQKCSLISDKLKKVMIEEKAFLNDELSLSILAKLIDESIHHLSEYINTIEHKNFYSYINGYRIKAAQDLIGKSGKSNLEIAYEVGFNSKSTFNRAFKESTGMAPNEYRLKS